MELKKIAKASIVTIYISAIIGLIVTIITSLINYSGKWYDICNYIVLGSCLIASIVFTICILIRTIQIYKEMT